MPPNYGQYTHFYFIIAAGVMLFFLIVYGFWYDHKEPVSDDPEWVLAFQKAGIPPALIDDLTHDDDAWYYNGVSTCVGYGDWDDTGKRFEVVCAGADGKKIGTNIEQGAAIMVALRNGGVHPDCPLQYPGAN